MVDKHVLVQIINPLMAKGLFIDRNGFQPNLEQTNRDQSQKS